MANVRQLKDHGAPIFPITHVSLVKGMEGRALMDATYAWDGTGTPDVSKIPAGVVVTYNGTDYTGTLVASASTTGRFYLVPSTTVQGEWDRYMTDGTGSSYAWKAAGNTSIPSPDVVDNETTDDSTKSHSAAGGKRLKDQLGELEAELNQLDLKVDEVFVNDVSEWTLGYYLHHDGYPAADANASYTEKYYRVVPGSVIKASLYASGYSEVAIVFYATEETHDVVSTQKLTCSVNVFADVEVPSGAKFARFCNLSNRNANPQVIIPTISSIGRQTDSNTSDIATNTANISANANAIKEKEVNLERVLFSGVANLDYNVCLSLDNIANTLLNNSGVATSFTGASYVTNLHYWPVYEGCKFYTNAQATGSAKGICYYNADKTFLSYVVGAKAGAEYTAPSGAAFVRICTEYNTTNPLVLSYKKTGTSPSFSDITAGINANTKLIDDNTRMLWRASRLFLDTSDVAPGLLSKTTGEVFSGGESSRYCKTYFPVNEGQKLMVLAFVMGSAAPVIFYDENKAFLSYQNTDYFHQSDYIPILVPSGAYFVRFCTENYTTYGLRAYKEYNFNDPEIYVEQSVFVKDFDEQTAGTTGGSYYPKNKKIEIKYNGELNNEKKFVVLNCDDLSAADFSCIIPLLNKYGGHGTFNQIRQFAKSFISDRTKVKQVLFNDNELGDHTWLHYAFPFRDALWNGQNEGSPDGSQVAYPSNSQFRDDAGDGKNVFGIDLTTPVNSTILSWAPKYNGSDISTAWGSLSDDECQAIRNWYSLFGDIDGTMGNNDTGHSNLLTLLDTLSNTYLGTSGNSVGSWDDELGEYTGGIFTGCKTSENHEVWERIMTITFLYYKDQYGLNYDIKNWSLPGSKGAGLTFLYDGIKYYDASHTKVYNMLAKFESSLLTDDFGNAKNRSWTDVLREFGYVTSSDYEYPSRNDGQLRPAMSRQYVLNAFLSRRDAIIYPTNLNKAADYNALKNDCPSTFFTSGTPKEVQMYDNLTSSSIQTWFRKTLDKMRLETSNGIISCVTIDSFDNYSERVQFEAFLKYCKSAGIEVLSEQESYDVCFNHKLENGNIIYNPRLRNTIKEFIPTSTDLPTSPDGYDGICSVSIIGGAPILTTTGQTIYNHFGIPLGNIKYKAECKGEGTITFKLIKNNSINGLYPSTLTTIGTISVNEDEFTEKTLEMFVPDNDLTAYNQLCEEYGDKVMGIQIVYSSGLQVKNIDLRKI